MVDSVLVVREIEMSSRSATAAATMLLKALHSGTFRKPEGYKLGRVDTSTRCIATSKPCVVPLLAAAVESGNVAPRDAVVLQTPPECMKQA